MLSAYLPKELCIVALAGAPVKPRKVPRTMTVSGGRTTPVTLVVPKGQPVQIENHDPFPHRIYDRKKVANGLGAADIEPTKSRTWTPPGPGSYELRDVYAPSLRSWIVVEPRAAAHAFPNRKGTFRLELEPGRYQLRAYFMGEPTGKALDVVVEPTPDEQKLHAPLVVKEGSAPKGKKGG